MLPADFAGFTLLTLHPTSKSLPPYQPRVPPSHSPRVQPRHKVLTFNLFQIQMHSFRLVCLSSSLRLRDSSLAIGYSAFSRSRTLKSLPNISTLLRSLHNGIWLGFDIRLRLGCLFLHLGSPEGTKADSMEMIYLRHECGTEV